MNQSKRILIIEDDGDISYILKDYLINQGYEAHIASTGAEGMRMLEESRFDYIILDIMLPDTDGIELCRGIRQDSDTPILILSARGSSTDKVVGLGFGADDYMSKPFSLHELAARIGAYFRRHGREESSAPVGEEGFQAGPVLIDRKSYRVTLHGQELSLSAKEFQLLYHLVKHRNQVFSKSQLLDAVWGYGAYGDENTVTVYIRRLREKLEDNPSAPRWIRTVWGVGYKFSDESPA